MSTDGTSAANGADGTTDPNAGTQGAAQSGAGDQGGNGAADANKAAEAAAAGIAGQDGQQGGEQTVEATWRDDWRDQLIAKLPEAEREKEAARLKRFQSPENVYRSLREMEKRMSSGMLKPTLPDNASEAEVNEYRKANGIPAEANADAYGLKFPDGYEASEADQADVNEFVAALHKDNIPPAIAQKVWNQYLGIKAKADQQLYEAAQLQTINNKAEIKAEWGRDYDRNVRLGNAFLVQAMGEDKAKSFMSLTLADGTKLGDHPDTLRFIAAQALATADDAALVTSEFADNGKSLDDQYQEALKLRYTDSKKYNSAEHQQKLAKLAAAKEKKAA